MISVQQVVKRFDALLAVDGVSFEIQPGSVVGFLGPNGAGKSTLLRMISTYLEPDSGSIQVAGHDAVRAPFAVRASLGYLCEHNALYEGMRVDRWLAFCGRARALTGGLLAERMGWVVERCGLDPVLSRRIQECSKGFRQRIGLAAALIHDPPVLVLDEPTHGLDPLQVVSFRDFVRALAPGRAILFSSHIVSEVLEISDRVLSIRAGKLVADEPLSALRQRASTSGASLEQTLLAALGGPEARA